VQYRKLQLGKKSKDNRVRCWTNTTNALMYKISPEFWKNFNEDLGKSTLVAMKLEFQMFRDAVCDLYQRFRSLQKVLERVKYLEEKKRTGKLQIVSLSADPKKLYKNRKGFLRLKLQDVHQQQRR
jgi:hypothetical protein